MSDEQHQMILDHYGSTRTLLKLAEECSELSAAITKYVHCILGDEDSPALTQKVESEMADVKEASARAELIEFISAANINATEIFKRERTLAEINKLLGDGGN